jgi:hypothetical protein
MISQLSMGEPMKILRGGFESNLDPSHLKIHDHRTGKGHGLFMGYNGVNHRVFRRSFVKVDVFLLGHS